MSKICLAHEVSDHIISTYCQLWPAGPAMKSAGTGSETQMIAIHD